MKNTVIFITYINRFILGVTLLLYFLIIFFMYGMVAQFVLGFSQVISFLILLFFVEEFTEKEKRSLLIYFIAVLLFFLGVLFFTTVLNISGEVPFFLISMGIAIYFTFVLETLNEKLW